MSASLKMKVFESDLIESDVRHIHTVFDVAFVICHSIQGVSCITWLGLTLFVVALAAAFSTSS